MREKSYGRFELFSKGERDILLRMLRCAYKNPSEFGFDTPQGEDDTDWYDLLDLYKEATGFLC